MSYFCVSIWSCVLYFFFFNDTATTEIYTLSLHDALPICIARLRSDLLRMIEVRNDEQRRESAQRARERSEEHTSELQSRFDLVCRLLLEKKKKFKNARAILIDDGGIFQMYRRRPRTDYAQ